MKSAARFFEAVKNKGARRPFRAPLFCFLCVDYAYFKASMVLLRSCAICERSCTAAED